VFIAVELIGKENYLNKEEILELQSLGFIFQSHAWSHYNLTKYSDIELNHEIYDSKIYLTNLLGKEVDGICFPQGYFSDRVIKFCIDAGYKKLYTSISGNYFDKIDEKILPRNLVQFSSPFEFKSILFGGLRCLKRRYIKLHYLVE
jgi:peptidoglycan/xylan/chitin deacetylase (PgdA/CDA1 family)